MARIRSASYPDIQQGILVKAAELFATRGYQRTSIADLTEFCAQSRGALYHYFESKDSLLQAMLDTYVSGMLQQLEHAAAQGGAPVDLLSRLIEVAVDYNVASPHEQVILLNDLASLSERDQQPIIRMQQRIVELFGSVLAQLDHGGKITRTNRKMYTMMLLGMINYAHTWYDPVGRVKPKHFADMVRDLFLRGIEFGASGTHAARSGPVVTPLRRRTVRC